MPPTRKGARAPIRIPTPTTQSECQLRCSVVGGPGKAWKALESLGRPWKAVAGPWKALGSPWKALGCPKEGQEPVGKPWEALGSSKTSGSDPA